MCKRLFNVIASLNVTVVCLCAAMLLVFLGTMAQKDLGLYAVQQRYFRSLFVFWSPQGLSWRIPVFPGGYLVGGVLVVNLIAAQLQRFSFTRQRIGLQLTHLGIVLLLLGQLATDMFQVESHMRLTEGESKNYSESDRQSELMVIDSSHPETNEVVAIPESFLAAQKEIRHEKLPATIRVKQYWPNSRLAQRAGPTNKTPPLATQGLGQQLQVTSVPPTAKSDERNLPSALIELATAKGAMGTWLVSLALEEMQTLDINGKPYQIGMRLMRYYKPHSLQLRQFRFDKHKGTSIPKNFSSRVRLQNPQTGEDREVLIYMNNPLRYSEETYYQSGYDENDPRVSILQVVRNPGWLTPYISCTLVGLGLTVQFMSHLLRFIRERRTA